MIGGKSFSAFVITYNEEDNIRACLESLAWVDEIVVVDSYSEDDTVEIAREYTDRIVEREFAGYVKQTRYAFQQTTGEWVMWLDADERLTPAARAEIRSVFQAPDGPDCDGYAFPRKNYFMGRWITHSGWYPQPKVRLFRREATEIVGTPPHPTASVAGPVGRIDADILHFSYPGGVLEMMRRSSRFAEHAAQARHAAGNRFSLLSVLAKPPLELLKKYLLQRGFLDGFPGLVIAAGSAYYRFVREVRLWELEHAEAVKPSPSAPET